MGKLIYALLLIFAIEAALYAFGGVGYSQTSLFYMLKDPSSFLESSFYVEARLIISALAIAGAFVGTFLVRSDSAVYSAFGLIVLTFLGSITNLWLFIEGQLSGYLGSNSWILSTILIAPLIMAFMMIVLEFSRGRD